MPTETTKIRTKSVKNVLSKKFKTFDFKGFWLDVFGKPEQNGVWLIYGLEKNGKTWFTVKLAEYLSTFGKTLYVSAEEGLSMTFQEVLDRANIDFKKSKLHFQEYEAFETSLTRLEGRGAFRIIIFDNVSFYGAEIRKSDITDLMKKYKNTLFVFLAHEDRNKPEGATAQFIKKMSKIFINIKGLRAFVAGRCPGGTIDIDIEKAQLYHGTNPTEHEK
ncbi:MAG: hypothetical protein R3279_08345 [Putridiphycobacter sp.]|nr:hypothetical protein [Putridiphycobacter sp.]